MKFPHLYLLIFLLPPSKILVDTMELTRPFKLQKELNANQIDLSSFFSKHLATSPTIPTDRAGLEWAVKSMFYFVSKGQTDFLDKLLKFCQRSTQTYMYSSDRENFKYDLRKQAHESSKGLITPYTPDPKHKSFNDAIKTLAMAKNGEKKDYKPAYDYLQSNDHWKKNGKNPPTPDAFVAQSKLSIQLQMCQYAPNLQLTFPDFVFTPSTEVTQLLIKLETNNGKMGYVFAETSEQQIKAQLYVKIPPSQITNFLEGKQLSSKEKRIQFGVHFASSQKPSNVLLDTDKTPITTKFLESYEWNKKNFRANPSLESAARNEYNQIRNCHIGGRKRRSTNICNTAPTRRGSDSSTKLRLVPSKRLLVVNSNGARPESLPSALYQNHLRVTNVQHTPIQKTPSISSLQSALKLIQAAPLVTNTNTQNIVGTSKSSAPNPPTLSGSLPGASIARISPPLLQLTQVQLPSVPNINKLPPPFINLPPKITASYIPLKVILSQISPKIPQPGATGGILPHQIGAGKPPARITFG